MLQNIEISVESNYIYVLILNLAADLACNFRDHKMELGV